MLDAHVIVWPCTGHARLGTLARDAHLLETSFLGESQQKEDRLLDQIRVRAHPRRELRHRTTDVLELHVLQHAHRVELVGLPAEARDIGPLVAHACERAAPAHRDHEEHSPSQVRHAQHVGERAARHRRVAPESRLVLQRRKRPVQELVEGALRVQAEHAPCAASDRAHTVH